MYLSKGQKGTFTVDKRTVFVFLGVLLCVCTCMYMCDPTPTQAVTDARLFMCEVWECFAGRWVDMHVFASACV